MGFLDILRLAAGPVIGAVIGLFTNYLAVKMMFRPYRALHIGKFHLPFTPGIIPRRQAALAGALGRMVSESLVKDDDLKSALLSDELTNTVVGGILSLPPVKDTGKMLMGEQYEIKREQLLSSLTDRILGAVENMDVEGLIKKEGVAAFAGAGARNPLIAMFLNESTVAAIAPALAERIKAYIAGDGREKLYETLSKEMEKLEERPLGKMLGDPEEMRPFLTGLYQKLVRDRADSLVRQFHIAETVEARVNAMHPKDLEKLVMSAMKKELDAVVRLGAVIGFILGLINTVINLLQI